MSPASDADIRQIEERMDAEGLERLWIIFHDYSARPCVKWIPRAFVATALRSGGTFARANLNFTIDDQQVPSPRFGAESGDFLAMPDPDTFTAVPYRPGLGSMFSYLRTEEGELWEGCPRGRLNAVLDRLGSFGLSARTAFEPELTLFRQADDGGYVPADRLAMYSLDRMDQHYDLLARIEQALTAQGVRVVQIGSEYGAGQVEINLQHEVPLKAADDLLIMRQTVRALARDSGLVANFTPKPLEEAAGNGLHIHLSLWDVDGGVDRSTGGELFGMSKELNHFIGGILTHARAICGVACPTANSYQRLQPASWAPAHISWGQGNRAALVRIPGSTRTRLEFRAGDHTANPYLYLAALIAAGIDGLERKTEPGPPETEDIGHTDAAVLRARGVRSLPRTAGEALDALEASSVVMGALGPVCGPELLRIKRFELERSDAQDPDWERTVYFERP